MTSPSKHDQTYLNDLRFVLENGQRREDRTGTGTIGVFGLQSRYNLADGFPLLTTKRVYWHGVVAELLWFLRGETNVAWLQANKCTIWDEWARPDGELGPVYGKQWRKWTAPNGQNIDQIAEVIEGLKANPFGRRHIVSAWNPGEIAEMALPPCHAFFQFHVDGEKRLSCQLYQRSADMFLGVPFNIASYALLTQMVAQICGLGLGTFVHTLGDAHIYLNHLDQVDEQLSRSARPAPLLHLDPSVKEIDQFGFEHIKLEAYDPLPTIKAPVAV